VPHSSDPLLFLNGMTIFLIL